MDSEAETSQTHMRIKTQLCRRFMQGTCPLVAPECNYAHGYHDLRTATGPRLCRMFMHTRHCSYGNNCRFLHATPPLPVHHVHPQQQQHENINFSFPQPQPGIMQNTECRIMQTSAAATTNGHSSAQNNTTQSQTFSSTPARNTSAITVATTSLHKNGPYAGKSLSDINTMQRVIRLYADWI